MILIQKQAFAALSAASLQLNCPIVKLFIQEFSSNLTTKEFLITSVTASIHHVITYVNNIAPGSPSR